MTAFKFARNLPVKHKMTLVSMAVTLLALILASASLLAFVRHDGRRGAAEDVVSVARLLADRSTAALVFDDRRLASENLAAVRGKRAIVAACVADAQGAVFALIQLRQEDVPWCAGDLEAGTVRFVPGFVEASEPVSLPGERVGTVLVRASLDELDALMRNYILLAIGVVVLTSLLAFVLSSRVIAYLSEPLTLLTRTAQQIALRGHEQSIVGAGEQISKRSEDEMGTLIDAFNRMLEQIRERDQFLQETNDQLEERVQRRTEALDASNRQLQDLAADLRQAKDMAEAANLAKSNFLARMSHELRTPLNAILGFSQLLGKDAGLSPDHREQLAIINRSGEHLLTMINDVLDLSKIEAGKMAVSRTAVDLHHLCREAIDLMRLRAQEKGLRLTLDIARDVPRLIRTDGVKLRQILINLLGNAVKFTHAGDILLALAAKGDGLLRIEVRDSGVGIPESLQASIFEPFVQGDDQATAKGTGLGLAITRKFVDMLGGAIGMESQPGKGAQFWIELPAEGATDDELPAAPGETRRVVGLLAGQPSWRVLVAEDDHASQKLIQTLLAQLGMEVRVADNGDEAVKIFRDWHPHLVLMDIRMPVLDGLQATRLIRATPGGEILPIIALTASVFKEEQPSILAAGCSDVMFKPIHVDALLARMADFLPIAYRFAEEAPPAALAESVVDPALATEEIAGLPRASVEALRSALQRLDADAAEILLSELAASAPEFVRLARQAIQKFDFGRVVALIDDGLHEQEP